MAKGSEVKAGGSASKGVANNMRLYQIPLSEQVRSIKKRTKLTEEEFDTVSGGIDFLFNEYVQTGGTGDASIQFAALAMHLESQGITDVLKNMGVYWLAKAEK